MDLRPGGVAGVLGEAGQQQRQPAQDDAGADPLSAVENAGFLRLELLFGQDTGCLELAELG